MYPITGLPACVGPSVDVDKLLDGIDQWVRCEPLRSLVEAFGGTPVATSLDETLARLDEFSARHWDFRGGGERSQARRPDFDAVTSRLIHDAAYGLGLVAPAAVPHRHYHHMVILGGLARGCLNRTEFAAGLRADGIDADHIAALGGFRELTGPEHQTLATESIEDCRFEADVMDAAVRRGFHVDTVSHIRGTADPGTDPRRSHRVTTYHGTDTTIQVVAAPSSAPRQRRANTADTCRFWADRVARLRPTDRVLVVTSQIFVPFQHCDAVSNIGLPYDCTVDTIGLAGSGDYTAPAYLQEIRSTIRSLRRLYETALAAGR
ncbi:MAG: hypothetical protein ACRD0P_17825 [Stackebrandtia sp.]